MSKKKKIIIIVGSICLCLIILAQFIGVYIDGPSTAGGECSSIVFDKAFVKGADKIVVREGDEVITITDKSLVREIAAEFVVANRTDLCGYNGDRCLDIYNGNMLVRHVQFNACCNLAEIYEADAGHWIFPSYSKVGQVELSKESLQRINEIIDAHRE